MEQHEERNARGMLQFMDRTVPTEITAEFSLPDYRSEISRLLWVRPTLMPAERFIGGGKADFSGAVHFDVLYVGPDGALYGAEPQSGYSFSVPLDALSGYDAAAGITLNAEPVIDSVISRVTGPRKLSVRCKMHARVRGYAEKSLGVRVKGAEESEQICRLCDMVGAGRVCLGAKETLMLTDTLEAQGDVRVIGTRAAIFLPEVAAGRDEIHCRGEMLITVLLCNEAEENALPYTACRRLPFEQSVAAQGVTPDCHASATAAVGEIHTSVEEGRICIEAQATLVASAAGEEPVLICRDLFLPGYTATCHFSEETIRTPKVCCNRNFSISGERALAELGLPREVEIIDAVADAEIHEKSADGARFLLSGEMCCHVLCRREGELCVIDTSFPMRLFVEQGEADMSVGCHVCACRVSVQHDALRADAELQLALYAEQSKPTRVLTEVSLTPAEGDTRQTGPEIYYPAHCESLWDVAKRYALSPEDLAAANGLAAQAPAAEDSLSGAKFLLIP